MNNYFYLFLFIFIYFYLFLFILIYFNLFLILSKLIYIYICIYKQSIYKMTSICQLLINYNKISKSETIPETTPETTPTATSKIPPKITPQKSSQFVEQTWGETAWDPPVSLGESFKKLLPVIGTELKPEPNQSGRLTPAKSLEYFKAQEMIAKIDGINLDPFDNKQINNDIYIENYIKTFCEQIFNNISTKDYPTETKSIPRQNHGGLNHLRSLKFGIWVITKIIEKSKNIIKNDTYEALFPSKQFLIMVILSTMFESIMRVNEDGSSSVLCKLSEDYLNRIYPDLNFEQLGGKESTLSTHQLASSIFFMVLMRKCFTDKSIISEKDIQLLGRGVAYHYIDDAKLKLEGLTIDKINEPNNLKFFIYYVITVSGHYLDHCRANFSKMINEPYIVKLFELFDIKDNEKIELIKLIVRTLKNTEHNTYNGKIEYININDTKNMKVSCGKLIDRYNNPNFKELSSNFEKCYTELNLELEIKNLLKTIPQKKITLMSWSILKNLYNIPFIKNKPEIRYKNQNEIIKNINYYMMENGPDILFTQESIVSILNYTSISTTYKNSAIGIYLKKNVFEIDLIIRSYYNPESNKYEQETPSKKLLDPINKYDLNYTRPIIAIRLKHMETDQYFIFVNVLFQVEYETKDEAEAKYESFKTHLELIIAGLYKENDRIIIAGDFSGISKFFTNKKNKKNNFDKININDIEIPLFLNQLIKNNTCCGSNTSQLKFDKDNLDKLKGTEITDLINNEDKNINFLNDLLYDSQKSSFVTVDTEQKTAYHYPIIGTINLGTIEAPQIPILAKNQQPSYSQAGKSKTGPQPGKSKAGPPQAGPPQAGKQQKTHKKTANPKTIKLSQSKDGKSHSHAGGNIKHINLTIKSKKLKQTKKLRKLKKLRN